MTWMRGSCVERCAPGVDGARRAVFFGCLGLVLASCVQAPVSAPLAPGLAAELARHPLPEPYLGLERRYLDAMPELRAVMSRMIEVTQRQMKDASQDILHNRVCAALAYKMAIDSRLPPAQTKVAVAADLLHNIAKEDKTMVLSNAAVRARVGATISQLRAAGYLRGSPGFWSDEAFVAGPAIGDNLALIHHATGAVMAGEMLASLPGFNAADVLLAQDAIVTHSTGYWYFRQSVDDAAKAKDFWNRIYPEPETMVARIAHDADLISQFEPESVVPEGSKWRLLAARRWRAKGPVEEAHVVYYVFVRLLDETRTDAGRQLARAEWDKIRPQLVALMKLSADADPLKTLGVPAVFRR